MSEIVKTMKLHIHVNETEAKSLDELTACYAQACTFISKYVFDHGFILNFMKLQETLYQTIRTEFGLKSQFTISAFKTVTARYKTVQEQMFQNPYRYENEKGETHFISRTLEWLQKPIVFRRPQADLVRGRDYSFVTADDGNICGTVVYSYCSMGVFLYPKEHDRRVTELLSSIWRQHHEKDHRSAAGLHDAHRLHCMRRQDRTRSSR